jgi:hypothetical protein
MLKYTHIVKKHTVVFGDPKHYPPAKVFARHSAMEIEVFGSIKKWGDDQNVGTCQHMPTFCTLSLWRKIMSLLWDGHISSVFQSLLA